MATIKTLRTLFVNVSNGAGVILDYDPMVKIGKDNPAYHVYERESLSSSNSQIIALELTDFAIRSALGTHLIGDIRILIPSMIHARIGALIARLNNGNNPKGIVDAMMSTSWAWMNGENGDTAWKPVLESLCLAMKEARDKKLNIDFEKASELRSYELNIKVGNNGFYGLIPDEVKLGEEIDLKSVVDKDGRRVSSAKLSDGTEVFCQGVFEDGKHKVSASKDSAGKTHYYVERTLPTSRMYRTHLMNLRAFYNASFDLLPHEEEVGEDFKFAV